MVENLYDVHARGFDGDLAFEKVCSLAEILDWDDLQAFNHRRFRRILCRNKYADLAVLFRSDSDGQNPFARSHRTGKREFADGNEVIELIRFNLLTCRQHAERDRQIKARPFLLHIGGREIDGGAPVRKSEPGTVERRGDAVARFFHRSIRQSDDHDERIAITSADLDFDGISFDAIDGGGTNAG